MLGRSRLLSTRLYLPTAVFLAALSAPAVAQVKVFISNEIAGSTLADRVAAEALRQPWQNEALANGACGFETGSIRDATLPVVLTTASGVVVTVSQRDMTGGAGGSAAVPQGNAGAPTSATMQAGSPKPESLYAAMESHYSDAPGDAASRNALLFQFSQPVTAFGAWFGDLETRTDGSGTPAILRFLDAGGAPIQADTRIVPSTSPQSQCGAPVNNSFPGCGNMTTVWLGFSAPPATPVAAMLVVVGDDDATSGSDTGLDERISFIGATLATPPPVAAAGSNLLVCKDQPAVLDGSASAAAACPGGPLYEWRNGAVVARAASAVPTWNPPTNQAGTTVYTLAVTCAGLSSCEATDDVQVLVRPCIMAVQFESYEARAEGQDVSVAWTTSYEMDCYGFAIERADAVSGPWIQAGWVEALGAGITYRFVDPAAARAELPWYRIVEQTSNGRGDLAGPFRAGSGSGASGARRMRHRAASLAGREP